MSVGYTAAEAAAILGISERTLRERAQKGTVARRDGRYFLDVDELPAARPAGLRVDMSGQAERVHVPAPSALEKWIVIPDCHVPFHNREHVSLMLRAAQAIGATNAVILGDFVDFYAVSLHRKDPGRARAFKAEVEEAKTILEMFGHIFTGRKIYCEGNHETRLERYLIDHAAAVVDMLRVEELLGLRERGWAFARYGSGLEIGDLGVTHDAGKAGKRAHEDAMASREGSVAIGHTHYMTMTVEAGGNGRQRIAASLGWLGDPDSIDYKHRWKMRHWAQGFGVAYVEPDGRTHLVPVPILDGRVCVEGRIVR